jgi:hypothetical protein
MLHGWWRDILVEWEQTCTSPMCSLRGGLLLSLAAGTASYGSALLLWSIRATTALPHRVLETVGKATSCCRPCRCMAGRNDCLQLL